LQVSIRRAGALAFFVVALCAIAGGFGSSETVAGWTGCAFERTRTREVYLDEAGNALVRAALGVEAPRHAELDPAPLEVDPAGQRTVAPVFPPTLVRAISYIESAWAMANRDTPRGRFGPVLTSSGCAYGIMQVLSGMQPATRSGRPNGVQRRILRDHVANIQGGLDLLAAKWNFSGPGDWPWVGERDPRVLEEWYYAAWAYYAMFPSLSPLNPDYPWPRPAYGSPECERQRRGCTYSDYPYQELVLGLVANPPQAGVAPSGQPLYLWEPKPVQLPARRLFLAKTRARKSLWPPPNLPAPLRPTLDDGRVPEPELALAEPDVILRYGRSDPAVFALPVTVIENAGTGLVAPSVRVRTTGPKARWLESWSLSAPIAPAELLVTFDPSSMARGEYMARFIIRAAGAPGEAATFTLKVCVDACAIDH
jgi:hypothetical protein